MPPARVWNQGDSRLRGGASGGERDRRRKRLRLVAGAFAVAVAIFFYFRRKIVSYSLYFYPHHGYRTLLTIIVWNKGNIGVVLWSQSQLRDFDSLSLKNLSNELGPKFLSKNPRLWTWVNQVLKTWVFAVANMVIQPANKTHVFKTWVFAWHYKTHV